LGCPDGLTFYKEGQLKDLFFCHAGADKAWVRDLGARLEAERIGNRNIEVFFDEWDIDHGENIVAKIDEGLKQARFCAVVLSPAMLKREWPQAEWTARFMADPSGRKGQLIPILLHERDPETRELIDIPMLISQSPRTSKQSFRTYCANSAENGHGVEGGTIHRHISARRSTARRPRTTCRRCWLATCSPSRPTPSTFGATQPRLKKARTYGIRFEDSGCGRFCWLMVGYTRFSIQIRPTTRSGVSCLVWRGNERT